MELDIWGELDEEMGGAPAGGNSAGETAFTYLPGFIPFGGGWTPAVTDGKLNWQCRP
ncbi:MULTISPECIES: hypothetical protein [Rhodococcus]|uniref:hypothetical protein n=1 Tax=Rhodococcus TaxID=1827 RepID=UPI0015CDA7AA|nr:hypothetical protein [Rhodococcus sp. ACS1]